MISIDEAEREFGVSRATLYRYIQKGELQTFHRGMDRRAYLRRTDLETLRRFQANDQHQGLTLEAIERARAFRERVFGDRFVSKSSAEVIEESRRERSDELG
jgi:DNA-binding transcriptional MerR regulator